MDKKPLSDKANQLLQSLSSPKNKMVSKENLIAVQTPIPEKKEEIKQKAPSKTLGISLRLEDRQKIKDISVWFTSQGIKASDSMIVQCALSMLASGNDLIDTYHYVRSLDQRIKIR
jgi:hypothetical protein